MISDRHDAAVAFIRKNEAPAKPFASLMSPNPLACSVCARAEEYSEAVRRRDLHPGGPADAEVLAAKERLRRGVEFYRQNGLDCAPYTTEFGPID